MLSFESENVEYKSIYVDDIKKEIIAFANTSGGKIYIGVDNNRNVCGVDNPDLIIQQLSNTCRDSIKPDITLFVHYNVLTIEKKYIIEINVQCGSHRPYYIAIKGLRPEGVYVRQGTSSVPASDTAIRKMIKETDGDNYEEMRSLNQNLTFVKAKEEFKKQNMSLEEPQMRTLELIDKDGLYTNLALLLSDQCPHIIKAATFKGVDSQNFQDRREFTGSLLQQLEDAYSYMDMRNNLSATFEGLLRIDHRDYPEVALRESLLNAIIHRDYSMSAGTLLSIYKNRVEIISIGGLVSGLSYDDILLGVSVCRNKNLANVFYRLKLIEAYGIGIDKIMSSYNNSASKPMIQVSSGAFKITIPNQNQILNEINTNKSNSIKKSIKKEKLLIELFNIFKKENHLTRTQVEKRLDISTSTARRLLNQLLEEGAIVCKNKGKNIIYILESDE